MKKHPIKGKSAEIPQAKTPQAKTPRQQALIESNFQMETRFMLQDMQRVVEDGASGKDEDKGKNLGIAGIFENISRRYSKPA